MVKLPLHAILKGGLGNQFFIFGNSVAYSRVHKRKLILNSVWYVTDQLKNLEKNGFQNPDLFKFPLIERNYKIGTSRSSKFIYKLFIIAQKFGDKLIGNICINVDNPFSRNKIKHSLVIYGDMIDSQNLNQVRTVLLELLVLNESQELYIKNYLANLRKSTSRLVALHVRRGDRITTNTLCNVLSKEYYVKCLKDLSVENPIVLIFSDDITWCKENFESTNIYFFENADPVVNFRAMMLCDDFILSTSTFGWWAAWLANRTDKKVVIPKPYVQDNPDVWESLIQKEWIQCEASWIK